MRPFKLSRIEILVLLSLIGLILAFVLPRLASSVTDAKKEAQKTQRDAINSQLDLYKFNNNGKSPVSDGPISKWTTDYQDYFPQGVPTRDVYGKEWQIKNGHVQ